MGNRISNLFSIKIPIIQAGMVWCSGWKLAVAVSNAGGLGIIGAGSMHPDTLRDHIRKFKKSSSKSFGVNVPLLYPEIEQIITVLVDEGVKIVFTSAGNPAIWTSALKLKGFIVVHVVSSVRFALKAQTAGVDAVVAEGFEAGGHNGREETTTLCLIPMVAKVLDIPVIAAGGIGSGESMLATFVLGAEGVQIGSRFAASVESSAHINFKNIIIDSGEGDTILTMKKLVPVRLLKNDFYETIQQAENEGATKEKLNEILGKRRAKQGIFEGDLSAGELEIGQVSANISIIQPAKEILEEIWTEFIQGRNKLCDTEL